MAVWEAGSEIGSPGAAESSDKEEPQAQRTAAEEGFPERRQKRRQLHSPGRPSGNLGRADLVRGRGAGGRPAKPVRKIFAFAGRRRLGLANREPAGRRAAQRQEGLFHGIPLRSALHRRDLARRLELVLEPQLSGAHGPRPDRFETFEKFYGAPLPSEFFVEDGASIAFVSAAARLEFSSSCERPRRVARQACAFPTATGSEIMALTLAFALSWIRCLEIPRGNAAAEEKFGLKAAVSRGGGGGGNAKNPYYICRAGRFPGNQPTALAVHEQGML